MRQSFAPSSNLCMLKFAVVFETVPCSYYDSREAELAIAVVSIAIISDNEGGFNQE